LGFATTLAGYITTIIMLTVLTLTAALTSAYLENAATQLSNKVAIAEDEEKIEIMTHQIVNSTTFLINITNTGDISIPVSKLDMIDIITTYVSNGQIITERAVYKATTGCRWTPLYLYTGNIPYEIINPVNQDFSSGLWDPGETLEIRLTLSNPADNLTPIYIVVSALNGAKDIYTIINQ